LSVAGGLATLKVLSGSAAQLGYDPGQAKWSFTISKGSNGYAAFIENLPKCLPSDTLLFQNLTLFSDGQSGFTLQSNYPNLTVYKVAQFKPAQANLYDNAIQLTGQVDYGIPSVQPMTTMLQFSKQNGNAVAQLQPVDYNFKADAVTLAFSSNTQTLDDVSIVDTLVGLSKYYQYVVVPQDYYGNLGTPSDTVLATTFDFRQVSIPDRLQTQSMKDTAGLKLTWRLRDTANVVSVEILRSLDADTGFVRIATVPPAQTSYLDETTEPMQQYFYRLVATGPFGERSVPSARAFGIYESPLSPLPPRLVQAEGIKNGVQLTIENSDPTIIGYRIYRNARYGDSLTLISGLVPRASAPTTSFLDSSLGLSGRRSCGYAVRSESKSHVLSSFSDTLYARPIIPIQLPTPTGLSATQPDGEMQKTVNLFWVDLTAYDDAVRGYRVFRRKVDSKAKSAFKPLFDSLLSAQENYFTDTTFTEFGIYEYAVQAFGMFESESALSASVQVEYKKLPPAPPADVRAIPTTEGVRITWGEVVQERLTGYKLYRYERGKTPTVLATLKPDEQTFLDTSAKKGTLYFYFVTSVAKTDESVPSEEVGLRP
jgi:hypothetical protein